MFSLWVTDENVSRLKVSTKSRNRNVTLAFFKTALDFFLLHISQYDGFSC